MAGVKGRSGGPRANAGGARPGAGRKPKPKPEPTVLDTPADEADMLSLLKQIALGQIDASTTQVRAAIAAVQYTHAKKGESSGKKEEAADKAKAAAAGRFGRREAPRLVANGGSKV